MQQKIEDLNELIEQNKISIQNKMSELEESNREMLQLKDMKLDFEGKLENIDQKEHGLKQEINTLKDHLKGKDMAINHLSNTLMEKGQENENLTEMVTFFKNKILVENCFHTTFGAQKLEGNGMQPIKNNSELTIGFIRDQHDEEEFYMEIATKENN